MSPWINYHHLFYFKTIAEEGSVSKAAEKLLLGQPTLSAQLKQFEESLGVNLFERRHKRLILTEQGKVALDYARSIFRMGSEMYEVLHDRLGPQKLSLHLGALDSIPKRIILQTVQYAYKVAPCLVTLSEGKSDELLRELTGHRVDLLITNFLPAGADAKGLSHRQLTKKNIGFFAAPQFKSLRKKFPQSISGQPMILPTHHSKLRYDLDHWFRNQKIDVNLIAESQDVAVKKLMAINGLGIIPAATHTVARAVAEGELIELGLIPGIYEELHLVSANRRIANPIATKIMKLFQV